jgi:hypothetical protein
METISVTIPDSIHKSLIELAEKDHVPIDQFITTAISEKFQPSRQKTILKAGENAELKRNLWLPYRMSRMSNRRSTIHYRTKPFDYSRFPVFSFHSGAWARRVQAKILKLTVTLLTSTLPVINYL